MKKIILVTLLLLSVNISFTASAQSKEDEHKARKEQFFQFRRQFMTEQIGLNEQEAEKFFVLYDAMEKEKFLVDKEARGFARKIARSETPVTDLEYEKAADALLEKEEKIARIERDYYEKFKAILSSEQLFKFKHAQMRLPHAMMKQRKGKTGDKK